MATHATSRTEKESPAKKKEKTGWSTQLQNHTSRETQMKAGSGRGPKKKKKGSKKRETEGVSA